MAGYTRQDTQNNISNGSVIDADDLDAEFNAIEAGFNSSTGHSHDGTAGEGVPITKVGPAQDLIVSAGALTPKTTNTLDLGTNSIQFKDAWFDGTVDTDTLTVSGNSTVGGTLGVTGAITATAGVTGDLTGNVTGNVTGTVSDVSNHDTGDIAEGSNLYHTTARSRAAISAVGNLSYNSTTGVMSYTQGSTDTVAEGSTNLYHTTARARASISAVGNLSYNSTTGVLSYTQGNTDTVAEGSSNLYFTNERVDDRVAALVVAGTNMAISYNDTAGTLTFNASSAGGYDLSNNDTGDLSEGSNLYFTTARARAAISATGSLSYNSSTGVISFTQGNTDTVAEGSTNLYYTNARARAAMSVVDAGGDGSLSYNSSTGAITYTGPSATEVRAHFSAGTGVTYSSGQFSIGQPVGTSSNVTFGNVTVGGDLTVSGTTTYINTQTLNIGDNIITLNADETGTPSADAGIEVERGTSANKSLFWDESEDEWTVGTERFKAGTFEGDVTGNVSGNATTATTLATSRTIALGGDLSGSAAFNGGSNITITATVADDSHNHTLSNIDGITATTTEINYVGGVSSNIQTQLNSKAPTAGSIGQDFSANTLNANTVDLGDWTVTESAGTLYFATGGVNKMKIDASGNLTVTGNVTGYGTV